MSGQYQSIDGLILNNSTDFFNFSKRTLALPTSKTLLSGLTTVHVSWLNYVASGAKNSDVDTRRLVNVNVLIFQTKGLNWISFFYMEDENKHMTLLSDKNCNIENFFWEPWWERDLFMQYARLVLLYLSVNESCFLTSELNGFGIGIESASKANLFSMVPSYNNTLLWGMKIRHSFNFFLLRLLKSRELRFVFHLLSIASSEEYGSYQHSFFFLWRLRYWKVVSTEHRFIFFHFFSRRNLLALV